MVDSQICLQRRPSQVAFQSIPETLRIVLNKIPKLDELVPAEFKRSCFPATEPFLEGVSDLDKSGSIDDEMSPELMP